MTLEVGDAYLYPGCEIWIKKIEGSTVTYWSKHHSDFKVEKVEPLDELTEFLKMWDFKKAPKGFCMHEYEFLISFTTLGYYCRFCGKVKQ